MKLKPDNKWSIESNMLKIACVGYMNELKIVQEQVTQETNFDLLCPL